MSNKVAKGFYPDSSEVNVYCTECGQKMDEFGNIKHYSTCSVVREVIKKEEGAFVMPSFRIKDDPTTFKQAIEALPRMVAGKMSKSDNFEMVEYVRLDEVLKIIYPEGEGK